MFECIKPNKYNGDKWCYNSIFNRNSVLQSVYTSTILSKILDETKNKCWQKG